MFLFYLEHYLTLFVVLFWPKTNKEKKNDQKHGLTPLEKCSFWDFKRLNLVWPKEVSFLYRTLLNIISSFILTENLTKEKNFWPKAWVTPLEKRNFLGLWKILCFKRFFFLLFWPKTKKEKNWFFWPKARVGKMRLTKYFF